MCRSFVVSMRICFIHVTRKMKNKGNKNENKKSQHDPHWMRRPKSFSRMKGYCVSILYIYVCIFYFIFWKTNVKTVVILKLVFSMVQRTNQMYWQKENCFCMFFISSSFIRFSFAEEIKLEKTRQKHIKSNIMKYCAWFHWKLAL